MTSHNDQEPWPIPNSDCAHVPLQVGVYHGPERNRSKTWLASQDVIITTYQTLAGDMGQVGRFYRTSGFASH